MKKPINTQHGQHCATTCEHCALVDICLPVGLSAEDLVTIESVVQKSIAVKSGEAIVQAGQHFKSVFAVKSGSFKSTAHTQLGKEQVVGFSLAGEMFGFDAIASQRYAFSVIALEDSLVCELPFSDILTVAAQVPKLQTHLFVTMSQNLNSMQAIGLQSTADERLANFLLNLSARLARRGMSATQIHLSMPRQDIANCLGLATETISRLLTKLQKKSVIKIDGRDILILDLRLLQKISCGEVV